MSKKKQAKTPAKPAHAAAPITTARSGWWPEEFASPRTSAIICFIVIAVIAIMLPLGAYNKLLWVKRLGLVFLGLHEHPMLPQGAQSWDVAGAICAITTMLGAALIHPSIGMMALLLLRPWIDGYTFPTANAYFIWPILLMTMIWGWRTYRGRTSALNRLPSALMLLFLLAVLAVAPASYTFGQTYMHLLWWFSYFLLFFLASNALRGRTAIGMVLLGAMLAMASQATYAILAYQYLFEAMRVMMQDPALLQQYFGTDTLTPDLAQRLNVNRAYGTMLFANALAGFLVLGLPYALAGAFLGWQHLLPAWRRALKGEGEAPASSRMVTTVMAAAWLVFTAAIFLTFQYMLVYSEEPAWYLRSYFPLIIACVAGAIAAALLGHVARHYGMIMVGRVLKSYGLTAFAVLMGAALLLTYSRGGVLAFLAACAWGGVLLFLAERDFPPRLRKLGGAAAAVIAALVLVAAFAAAAGGAGAAAQDAAAPAVAPEGETDLALQQQGVDVTMQDLLSPATFSIRLTYWRVSLKMLADNLWPGVGLGAFGVAYPRYQYIGAGDVNQAHNGYLQMLCEAGLLGGLLFIAFWVYFVLYGARRILRERNAYERLTLAGIYTGVVAFILHAAIDVHFSHPSLAMFCFVFAGIFFARARMGKEPPADMRRSWRLWGIPLLLLPPLLFGLDARIYAQDFAFSRGNMLNLEDGAENEMVWWLQVERFFIETMRDHGILQDFGSGVVSVREASAKLGPRTREQLDAVAVLYEPLDGNRGRPLAPDEPITETTMMRIRQPIIDIYSALYFGLREDELERLGRFYVPLEGRSGRRPLRPGESLPPDAVLDLRFPFRAYTTGVIASARRLALYEHFDALYGHDPEVAAWLADGYGTLASSVHDSDYGKQPVLYRDKNVAWAKEAVSRSPYQPDYRVIYGDALMRQARAAQDAAAQKRWHMAALEQYEKAADLAAILPYYAFQYANALSYAAEDARKLGQEQLAQQFMKRSQEVHQEATELQELRWSMNLS